MWWKIPCSILFIIICVNCSSVFAQELYLLKTGEYELHSRDGAVKYIVRFPGRPDEIPMETDEAGRRVRKFRYTSDQGVSYRLVVTWEPIINNLTKNIYMDPSKAIQEIKALEITHNKSIGWELIEENPLTTGYDIVWKFPYLNGDGYGYMRTFGYLRHGSGYVISVVALNKELLYRDTSTRFLNSFKFPTMSKEEELSLANVQLPAMGKWYQFADPEKEFSIKFPSEPVARSKTRGFVSMIREFQSIYGSYKFFINIQDLSGNPESPENNVLPDGYEEVYANMMKGQGFKIVSAKRIAKNKGEIEQTYPNSEQTGYLHLITRFFVNKGKTFTIGCGRIIKDMEVDKNLCQNFFESFKLIK